MTYDEVIAAGKVASCQLASGAMVRFEPHDGTLQVLPYPGTPRLWREAKEYLGMVPQDGWSHYPGCACDICQPVTSSPGASAPAEGE